MEYPDTSSATKKTTIGNEECLESKETCGDRDDGETEDRVDGQTEDRDDGDAEDRDDGDTEDRNDGDTEDRDDKDTEDRDDGQTEDRVKNIEEQPNDSGTEDQQGILCLLGTDVPFDGFYQDAEHQGHSKNGIAKRPYHVCPEKAKGALPVLPDVARPQAKQPDDHGYQVGEDGEGIGGQGERVAQRSLRHKYGEVAVLHTQLLDLSIEEVLNEFPNGVRPGTENIAAAHTQQQTQAYTQLLSATCTVPSAGGALVQLSLLDPLMICVIKSHDQFPFKVNLVVLVQKSSFCMPNVIKQNKEPVKFHYNQQPGLNAGLQD
ncbi:LOW QUALITY PROTEIN: hypothetical protein U0070_019935 [Myodes glareolus]|uniref:Uncharacterized protein n=1 Tax=Myodes glareolus TaxID=447135 RepID=A0AAW0JK42_MYOGA